MELSEIIRLNILSPMVLAFALGIIAVVVKSDLKIPEQVYSIISIYLLFAIGLKGGFDLARSPVASFGSASVVAALIGLAIPLWSFFLLHLVGKMSAANAVAVAIHYGAVSAVTLSASITFLNEAGQTFEGFMPTMYVIMEIPAVILGLALAQWYSGGKQQTLIETFRSALTGKGFLLLGGGVLIGFISGEPGYQQVKPFFVDLFPGFLALFLLEMGTLVGARLKDLRRMGWALIAFALIMPLVHGLVGVWLGGIAGLSAGGAMIMGALAASASYITAPAVVEANIPDADITFPLTASLVLTFPLNLTVGLPIYYQLARIFAG
jgi:hypothetical protein